MRSATDFVVLSVTLSLSWHGFPRVRSSFDPIWPPLSIVITVNSGFRHREYAIKPRKLPRSLRYFLVYPLLFWSLSFLTFLSFLNIRNKTWAITLNNFMERPPSWEAYSRVTDEEFPPPPTVTQLDGSLSYPQFRTTGPYSDPDASNQHLRIVCSCHIHLDLPSGRISSRRTIKLLWEFSVSCVRSTSSANQILTNLITLT
jgi:hypothetical protein